ncbi:hypothetical protein MJM99_34680, partial [Salmonella enterica subsp. enterica serovar Kentucky]|nr:hypothetical protein [Salmonella enterica subsp. enterica serovar Kentucky]
NRQQAALAKQLDEVQQKVATISGSDAKTWLLAQADFLVKLAGRSLTVDKKMMDCGSGIYASINTLLKKSQNKNIVIFTHNHCL